MLALVKTIRGVGNVALMQMPEPVPGPGQAKIEVLACGICGTDIHIYHDRSETRPPVIMGHEFSGIVREVGAEVEHIQVGERVVSETTVWSCGVCRYCRMGCYHICPKRHGLGRGANGAFARYVVLPAVMLHRAPDGVDTYAAALTEPLACCVHAAAELTRITSGDVVLVTGDGAIGLLTMQVAKAQGATVLVSGHHRERLELARALGADQVIKGREAGADKLVSDLTNGYGVDVVLECSGSEQAIDMGLDLVRPRGQVTFVGLAGGTVSVNLDRIAYKELAVAGSFNQQWTSWERALKYLQEGSIQTLPLVSDILPLSQWHEGLAKQESRQATRVLLIPE